MSDSAVTKPASVRGSAALLLLVLPALAATALRAQHDHAQHAAASQPAAGAADGRLAALRADTIGGIPRALLERPVALRSGLGRVHEPITTSSRDAQAFYNQGIAYHYSFNYVEAARAFNQAIRLDSAAAIPWVGLSRAYASLGAREASRAAFARARELARGASARERTRIELRQLALDAAGDSAKRAAYRRAVESALADDMGDPSLWVLRGQLEEERGGRSLAAAAFYEGALARDPDHIAAHHYLVHFYEGYGRIDLAVKHGERLASIAPSVAHAQHMYGHDLRRVGRVDEAIREFSEADSIERAHYAAEDFAREYDWHHPHNLTLLALSYAYQGRLRLAERLLREKAEVRPLGEYNQLYNRRSIIELLLLRQRHDEALAAARALDTAAAPASLQAASHVFAGSALLALGRVDEAKRELDRAERARKRVPEAQRAYLLRDETALLRGALLLRRGKLGEGVDELAQLQRRLRARSGPDAWIDALFGLEQIARVARDAGAWGFAERSAREIIAHDSAYAGGHYALAVAAAHNGDAATARQAFAAAERLWGKADADLPELAEARTRAQAVSVR